MSTPSTPGTFLLTFDVELLWGLFFERSWRERALAKYGAVREVFPEILALLERYDVRATFAFVGHLFLDRCERVDGIVHPELVRPRQDLIPGDWYGFDPATDLERAPLWYGRDLVDLVRGARPEHEIGAHGFSHAFLTPDQDRELARAEMRAAAGAAAELGLEPRSFVYPRNLVGHVEELAPAGFTCYREGGPRRGPVRRALSFLHRFLGLRPPVGRPREKHGVVEVPASVPILPAIGIRRFVPLASLLREVRGGLTRARDEEALFHLWTHPHNFVEGRERMLAFLSGALARVAAFRDRGEIRVATMTEVGP